MGNAVEASKLQTSANFQDEMANLVQNHKNRKSEEELEWAEFFKGEHDHNLGQLCGWTLSEIKSVYDKFRRLSHFPIMDRIMFSKIMPFTKRNSFFIFSHLTGKGKAQCMSIYELICLLATVSYANFANKVRLMFAIFDFNGTMTLSFPEWSVLVISFLQAVARLLKKDFLSKTKMEKIAKIVFIKADIAPYDNVLDYSERLKDWLESASTIMSFFQRYAYTDNQTDAIYKNITLYGIADEVPDDIKEMIESSSRPGYLAPKNGDEANSNRSSRKNSLFQSKHLEALVSPKASRITLDSPTRQDATSVLPNITSVKNSKKNLVLPPLRSSSIEDGTSLLKSKSFASPINRGSLKSPKEFTKEEILERKRKIWLKARNAKRNVLITNGKTISKTDILNLKAYFDSIADGEEQLTLKNFVRSFSKNSNLQKVSASLFNFLDDKAHGYVTFEGLIKKLYPNLTKEEFDQLIRWSVEDELIFKSKTSKKFMEEAMKGKNPKEVKPLYEVPKEAIKKLKYIFDLYDEEKKGYVSLENLRKKFSSIYSWKEIEKKFEEFDKDKDGVLNLKEFVDIILPPDFYLDPALIKDISS